MFNTCDKLAQYSWPPAVWLMQGYGVQGQTAVILTKDAFRTVYYLNQCLLTKFDLIAIEEL